MARFLVLLLMTGLAPGETVADLLRAFEHPPDDSRIMMRWWWFGPSVTKLELEREMRLMKAGGIGGFEVQPVYPLALEGNFPYLSDEFIDALRFTSEKARELGLRMDVTLGSGWPFGGPHIPITKAAGRLRCDRVPVSEGISSVPMPNLTEGEKLLAAFLAENHQRLDQVDRGRLRLPSDLHGSHAVLFFIASRTGQTVKRPAVGAEGFVLDPYDRSAIDTHLNKVGDRLMPAFGKNPPYAVFSDSLEVYNADWTGDFIQEFERRRGYDLTPYLPALVEDIGEKTASVRHDWGKTLTELADERYLTPLRDWARQHGTRFRSQTYGTPPVNLSSNSLVDLPGGEGTQWRQFSTTRWASSASHLYGKPVTSSETWTWLHSPAFRATPLDMKAEADLHFLQGVNQLIGHGWPYSPESAGSPGWRFYAAAVFNDHNPWWLVMPDITAYLQRVSFLLRQGKPANDVAVYLPTDDAWAQFTVGHVSVSGLMDSLLGPNVIPQILDAGYNFDFIDDGAIERVGVPYPVLVIPGAQRIPDATSRKLEEYVKNGGIVITTRREEQSLGRELNARLTPDVKTAPEIGFIHRKLEFAEVYFLVNTSNHPVHSEAVFRVKGLEAAWWDPFAGEVHGASSTTLDLAPYESRVLVFSKQHFEDRVHGTADVIDISSDWKINFPRLGRSGVLSTFRSWTDDEETRFFSGEAIYEKTVTVTHPGRETFLSFGEGMPLAQGRLANGMRAWLESPVREAAVVYVNEKRAGPVWRPPYEVNVTGLLRPGENKIRVVVGNLAINELAGKSLPDYKLLNSLYGVRFQAQDMENLQPLPAGLLGPVHLIVR
jgi:hypothetical protein